jgi:erythromycin esterase
MATHPLPDLVGRVRRRLNPSDPAGVPDADLLARWTTARDEAAFECLVWRHGPMVLATCRRVLGPGPDADDAFQATFLTLVRRAGQVRSGVGGWLHRVAYRVALRVRARRRPTAALVAEPAAEPAHDADWHDLRPVLDREIDALPERFRAPFVLCYLQGKTNEQAARELGRPVGTILSRLATARQKLRARLTRRGVGLSAAAAVTVPASLARAAVGLGSRPAPSHLIPLCLGATSPMRITLLTATVLAVGVGLVAAVRVSADPPAKAPAKADKPDGMTPGHPKGWGGGPFGMGEYTFGLDRKDPKEGKAAAFVRADKPGNGATLTQQIAAKAFAGKRVRLSAQVKTRDVSTGTGLWLRIDSPDGTVGFDNMFDRRLKGDTAWTKAEVVLDVDEKATGLTFGLILFNGSGTVWVDDMKLEVVGKDVKVTAEDPEKPSPPGLDSTDGLPETPTNLGFEEQARDLRVVPTPLTAAETAWLKKAAIPLTAVEAGKGFKDLQPLKSVVGAARIVSLGESTHGTREHFQMKHRLLEFLVAEMGFTHFAIEANMTEAFAINDYVLTGTGSAKKALAGLYFWTWYTEEVLAMIEWMRDYNRKHGAKVQFLGFDMQTGTVAAANAKAFVAKADPAFAKEAERLFEKAAPLFPKTPDEQESFDSLPAAEKKFLAEAPWEVVAHLEKNRDKYLKTMKAEEVDRGLLDARIAAQAAKNGTVSYNYRDECMAANVGWILDHAPKGSKIVLWAHNGHVSRSDGAMGSHLAKKYGKEMVIVGFGAGEGTYTAISRGEGLKKDNKLVAPKAGSLEKVLRDAKVGDCVLDLRPGATNADAQWLQRPHYLRMIGALAMDMQFQPCILPELYDVIVFVDRTTASRCFGFTQAEE